VLLGRRKLKPVFASTDSDLLCLGSLTQCRCVILCDLTTCYSSESTWLQRVKLKHDKLLSSLAYNCNLRRYMMAAKIDNFVDLTDITTKKAPNVFLC